MNTKRIYHFLLLAGFFLAIAGSIGVAFYRFFIARDYEITFEYPCEPTEAVCYEYQCGGEDCESEDPEPYFYQVFSAPASLLPTCDPTAEDCPLPSVCESEGSNCVSVPCEESPDDGVSCTDPSTFVPEENLSSDETMGREDAGGMDEGISSPPQIESEESLGGSGMMDQ